MHLHPLRNKQKHIMCPLPLRTTWQLTYFSGLKIHHVLILVLSSLVPIMVADLLLTHTWLIESEVLQCLSYLVMIERGEGEREREKASLSIILQESLATIVSYQPPSPTILRMY